MRIIKIVPQKYKKQYCSVFLDENYSFRLHNEIAAQYQLQENTEIDEKKYSEIKFVGEKKEAHEYAYLFLSYRSRSEKEMRQRLKQRNFSQEAVDAVIQELKEHNFINDIELAKGFTESRMKNNLWGKFRVRQDLIQKGIEPKLAENVMESVASENQGEIAGEDERAYQLLLRRNRQIRAPDSHTLYRRLSSYLERRGFSNDTIEGAMNRFLKKV